MKHTLKEYKGAALFRLVLACMVVLASLGIMPKSVVQAKSVESNVATTASIEVENNQNQANQLIDGNLDTDWQYRMSFKDIPNQMINVHLKLEESANVSRVNVYLGSRDWNDTQVDVEVFYAQNGITSDLIPFGQKKTAVLGSDVVVEQDVAVSASDVYVKVSNPRFVQGARHNAFTLWPSLREIEIIAKKDVKLSNYNNIASQATVSTDGNELQNTRSYLTDQDTSTLYKFHNGPLNAEKWVKLEFDEVRQMDACTVSFEHLDKDPYSYGFEFSVFGIQEDGSEVALANHLTANRLKKSEVDVTFGEGSYRGLKILMHKTTNVVNGRAGIGWPAIAEVAVFGSEVHVEDYDSIAFRKPVHTNTNRRAANAIVDGSLKSVWSSSMYPAYCDIDLMKNYNLSEIIVVTPSTGYSNFKIYTSLNGRDFTYLTEKNTTDACPIDGDVFTVDGVEARYVRVYVTYQSTSPQAILHEVRVKGVETNSPLQSRPEIAVEPYEEVTITQEDTINEVKAIVERRLGAMYVDWFDFVLADNPKGNGLDFFEIASVNGKTQIKGNTGVSLAMGLNHYLKYMCFVNVSQVEDQVQMPSTMPVVEHSIMKETKAKVRYAYNYCTLSYSMPFYGEKEWRDELDWLALNGVNVVLDATAQEEVWRRFLGKLGYLHEDAKDFIAGPAYYAWAYMANLSGFGGPIHDSWFEERTELARKNHVVMRRLGMEPVLQGYSGMVPNDLAEHDEAASRNVIKQGEWCAFQRPDMLKTDSDTYRKYAKLFYEAQKEVYGSAKYFATDPFHEGGKTGGMSPTVIARGVMDAMLEENGDDAVWIIQSWQGNPSSALLAGLEGHRDNALVLDLYAEKSPHYNEPSASAYGRKAEFDGTPWVYCMLNNFGGRLGLHGHLDYLEQRIPDVFNAKAHVAGIGITPEASVNNPLLYDYFFETIWQDDASHYERLELDAWLKAYAKRRYGSDSKAAYESLLILKDTVYKGALNMLGQGAPENVVNARPRFDIQAASAWGNSVIGYDKAELEKATSLMLEDYDVLKDSAGYRYDLATILQQVLSNSAQNQLGKMKRAYQNRDVEAFQKESATFMVMIDAMEEVTSTSSYYLLGTWTNQAKRLASNADDFAKDVYMWNAKALITTWGSYNQAETGRLHDYSNRQWSGLIEDFYKKRWEMWIANRVNELNGQSVQDPNWFVWEWNWTLDKKDYSEIPSSKDLKVLGEKILNDFSVVTEESSSKNDVSLDHVSVSAGNHHVGNANEGDPNLLFDNRMDTLWHTDYAGSERNVHYLVFTLDEKMSVSGIRYLGRNGGNGAVKKYKVYVKEDESSDWQEVKQEGVLDPNNGEWQILKFDENKEYLVKEVKFEVLDAVSNVPNKLFASAVEMRLLKGSVVEEKQEEKEPSTPSEQEKEPPVKDEENTKVEETGETKVEETQPEVEVNPDTEKPSGETEQADTKPSENTDGKPKENEQSESVEPSTDDKKDEVEKPKEEEGESVDTPSVDSGKTEDKKEVEETPKEETQETPKEETQEKPKEETQEKPKEENVGTSEPQETPKEENVEKPQVEEKPQKETQEPSKKEETPTIDAKKDAEVKQPIEKDKEPAKKSYSVDVMKMYEGLKTIGNLTDAEAVVVKAIDGTKNVERRFAQSEVSLNHEEMDSFNALLNGEVVDTHVVVDTRVLVKVDGVEHELHRFPNKEKFAIALSDALNARDDLQVYHVYYDDANVLKSRKLDSVVHDRMNKQLIVETDHFSKFIVVSKRVNVESSKTMDDRKKVETSASKDGKKETVVKPVPTNDKATTILPRTSDDLHVLGYSICFVVAVIVAFVVYKKREV